MVNEITGSWVTVTCETAEFVQPAMLVAITVNCPERLTGGFKTWGFCWFELKPEGPAHEKVDPAKELEVKLSAWSVQTVPPVAVTVGVGFTTKVYDVGAVQLFTAVTVKLYTPERFGAAFVITGFCCVELKPNGPVHK